MTVPDELIDLFHESRINAQGNDSADIDGEIAALAAVLERHEQMVRQQIAEEAREAANDCQSDGNGDAANALDWFADKITAGGPDA